MKLKHTLIFSALIAGFARVFSPREECHNAMADSPHPNGNVPILAAASPAVTGLLVRKNGTNNSFVLCGRAQAEIPLGPCTDTPAIGEMANVRMLGAATGTTTMRAAGAIAPLVFVYSAWNGQISATGGVGCYLVGTSVTAATAANQEIEVAQCFPIYQTA